MSNVHMILQGKGGVGKSLIASVLAQYKKDKGTTPFCVDTDPVNATFHGFRALDVHRLLIMEGDEINTRKFDNLVELIATSENDVIIDNGASSFVPLSHYLISNEVPTILHGMGHKLIVHTAIAGGQMLLDTIHGFAQLAGQFPGEAEFVVWLNPYWGVIESDGKTFEQMKVYKDHKSRISAIVQLPELKAETFGQDLSNMLQERLTFTEALNNEQIPIMERQRLAIIRKSIYDQLDTCIAALS
ncbi:MAG: conjugal transfer protein TraL [Methylococcales bacterium]|nr:conjugal transfer protein TraL [Methylococcales bacterium]